MQTSIHFVPNKSKLPFPYHNALTSENIHIGHDYTIFFKLHKSQSQTNKGKYSTKHFDHKSFT